MSRYIDADAMLEYLELAYDNHSNMDTLYNTGVLVAINYIKHKADTIDIVRCENCRKSHIDGKTTHYLWCTEWGRSTDVFGYCERGEREGE